MDARIRYTKMMIKMTFLELLKSCPVKKITVKGICDKAEINRATFYKYYDNPIHLMECLETELLDSLQEKIMALKEPELAEIFILILRDILDNREMYMILFSENGDKLFKDRLFNICYKDNIRNIQKYFPEISQYKQEWVYYFIAEGCMGILKQWINNGMQQEPEEIVQCISRLIYAINNKSVLSE